MPRSLNVGPTRAAVWMAGVAVVVVASDTGGLVRRVYNAHQHPMVSNNRAEASCKMASHGACKRAIGEEMRANVLP